MANSDWSESDHIDLENVYSNQPAQLSQFGPIIGGTLTGLALICVVILLFALNVIKKSQEKKPILDGATGEHELAVLGKNILFFSYFQLSNIDVCIIYLGNLIK